MNESLYLNKISYQLTLEKRPNYVFWISIFFTLILIISSSVPISLSMKTTAIYNDEKNTLEIIWDYEKIEELNQFEKIEVDEIQKELKILNISEIRVLEETHQNYQIIEIESPKTYRKNQVVSIMLYDKKEKLIKKLKKIILGG